VFVKAAELLEAIESLDVDCDLDEIRSTFAALDKIKARLAPALVDADAAKLYEAECATSMIAWLKTEGLHRGDAIAHMTTARTLAKLPQVAAAYETGQLRSGHVREIVSHAPKRFVDEFAAQQDTFVPILTKLTAEAAGHAMRAWKQAAKDRAGEKDPGVDKRELHFSEMLDGRHRLDGEFDAETSATITRALQLAEQPNTDSEPDRSAARRRGDALASVFWFFLTHHEVTGSKRNRPHVNITVNGATGDAVTPDAKLVPSAAVNRWLCDSVAHRVVLDDNGVILDHGRGKRTATDEQWATLITRDGGCRAHGCDRGPHWCEAHHVHPWEHGGFTDIDNLVLACERHHHLCPKCSVRGPKHRRTATIADQRRLTKHKGWHSFGWELKLLPDATLETTLPSGRVLTTRPRGVDPPRLC
jgi:hypothetical protein